LGAGTVEFPIGEKEKKNGLSPTPGEREKGEWERASSVVFLLTKVDREKKGKVWKKDLRGEKRKREERPPSDPPIGGREEGKRTKTGDLRS